MANISLVYVHPVWIYWFPVFNFLRRKVAAPVLTVVECRWEPVDASWFPGGVYQARANEVLHGPVALFWPNGHLRNLIYFDRGKPSCTHNRLELAEEVPEGNVISEAIYCEYRVGTENMFVEFDGESETHQTRMEFAEFVRKWIAQIAGQVLVTLPPPTEC